MRIPELVVIAIAIIYCCISVEYCRSDYEIQGVNQATALKARRNHPSYYNWDDGVDYNRLCRILLKQVNSPKNTYTIINNGIAGGLGHKTRSIIASLTNAIMLGRNYKLYLRTMFWNNLDTCFKELRYDGNLTNKRVCGNGVQCVSELRNFYTLANETLIFEDYRIYPSEKQIPGIVNHLRSIGFLKENENYQDYHRYIVRLLLNPIPSIQSLIRSERMRIGYPDKQIGVHLRCGGFLADTQEKTAMITPERLALVPRIIQTLLSSSNATYVYLSTDSTFAFQNITRALYPIPVKSTQLFHRGHTEKRVDEDVIKRTLLELYLVSESRALLLTSASSYSQLIRWITSSKQYEDVYAPYYGVNLTEAASKL